jgi:adenylate kinase
VEGSLPATAQVVFVLGGPGSGKGTQCERIVAKYGYQHLSAGDLLRDEVASGSEAGKMCSEIMKEGKLVPMAVTIQLLKNAMVRSGKDKFLIDGFPRALDQAFEFEKGIMKPRAVLFFDCPMEVMEERLLNRGKTSGRADDNAETIKKRFVTFTEQSLPVTDHYAKEGKLHKISAVPAPDEVFGEVVKALDALETAGECSVSIGESLGRWAVSAGGTCSVLHQRAYSECSRDYFRGISYPGVIPLLVLAAQLCSRVGSCCPDLSGCLVSAAGG